MIVNDVYDIFRGIVMEVGFDVSVLLLTFCLWHHSNAGW